MEESAIQKMRRSYERGKLEKEDLLANPMDTFTQWLQVAVDEKVDEANAMALSTVNEEGQPSQRIVLLKGMDEGLIFYTNYSSKKGKELFGNPKAGMLFFWKELERQVRIQGTIEKVSDEQSKAYFQSRPKGSQLGAWASPQSKIIADRSQLDDRVVELQDIYQNYDKLPRPAHWGGYRLIPNYFEFWQGRKNRLHDRFVYQLEEGNWEISQLAP